MTGSFEMLKSKLMEQACNNFQEKIETTDFEKPPEEETFKENASTEEAVKKALEIEAQRAKIAQYAVDGSYTIEESPKQSRRREKESVTENKGSESRYSWGSGYGYGYSSTSTTTKTETADALKKKAAKAKVEKRLDQIADKLDVADENKNIFELAAEKAKEKEVSALKMQSPKEYNNYVQKSRLKSDMAKGILGVIKDILENINIIGDEE